MGCAVITSAVAMLTRFSAVLLMLCSVAMTQSPAGGKWTYVVSEDKLTGAPYGIFGLMADEQMADEIGKGFPSFLIMCGGTVKSPHWITSSLRSPVVLGKPDTRSVLTEIPQQIVALRADDNMHTHAWNMAGDFRTFMVDKGATKELIEAKTTARIQFRDSSEHKQVAIFSPSGLNMEMLTKACGKVFR